jgi:hypothetical protein
MRRFAGDVASPRLSQPLSVLCQACGLGRGTRAAHGASIQEPEGPMTMNKNFTELRLTRAYIRLFLVPEGDDGSRTVSLARFGNYDVRLIEMPTAATAVTPLWMELYAHDSQTAVDSCSCDAIEEAVQVAEELIAQARHLSEGATDARRELRC